jgi:hypothetical protein
MTDDEGHYERLMRETYSGFEVLDERRPTLHAASLFDITHSRRAESPRSPKLLPAFIRAPTRCVNNTLWRLDARGRARRTQRRRRGADDRCPLRTGGPGGPLNRVRA